MPLIGHMNATSCYIYMCLWGHNIDIVLQLDGCYNAPIWPLIKYYWFTIHIKNEFVDLKLDPSAT